MDNSYPFHKNPGLFLQSQNRASGLSKGSPHFLHRFLLVEPISIPISGLLITKIEFITQILTQQPTTVSGHSRTAQKSPKNSTIQSHVLGPILRPIPGIFHINTCILIQNFHTNSLKILGSHGWWEKSPIISNNSVPCFGTDQTAPHGLKLTETSKNP